MDFETIVLVFLLGSVASVYVGVKLMKFGGRPVKEPEIPPARTANPGGIDRVVAKASRFKAKAWRPAATLSGLALIAAPVVIVWEVLSSLGGGSGGHNSKGRVLRIKDRARLAERAFGDGWSGELVTLGTEMTAGERATLGELWLLTARMEHASVAAFSQLALHLSAVGAPSELLAATHRAALEEITHARACFAIVRAITGVAHTAGPIAELGASSTSPIDLTRLAIGSLIDGCLAEGIAADVAGHSAARAVDPVIRDTLTMIARDEAGHAELAWDVLAWCLAEGDAELARAVGARASILDRELTPTLPAIAGADDVALARHGVIDQASLGTIALARIAAVKVRASALVASCATPAARAA